jgi:hypothetical protein
MLLLSAFFFLVEVLLQMLEHHLSESMNQVLDAVHKELAMMGLISFIFFWVDPISVGDALKSCELAHMLIFFLMLFYLARSVVLIRGYTPIKKQLAALNYDLPPTCTRWDSACNWHRAVLGCLGVNKAAFSPFAGFKLIRDEFLRLHYLPEVRVRPRGARGMNAGRPR